MRAVSVLFGAVAFIACAPRAKQDVSGGANQSGSADSLMLRRTRCFGLCPAYRITVTPAGRITYQSADPRDTSFAIASSSTPSALRYLTARARAIGFFDLPSEISRDPDLCPVRATDMPTAIITIFAPDSTRSVTDYHGCFVRAASSMPQRLAKLRGFEAEIDSVLGSARFVKRAPAR